jgi:ABC-2 type transport system ATP-binding protein
VLSNPAIETYELTRHFPSGVALDHLTLSVEPGEVLALLGPNGAGKTTTVRLLNGVLRPNGGWAKVLGVDPEVDPNEVRRHTGVLTEHAGLDERLTAVENLLATARIRGLDDQLARRRIGEMLERFGMSDRADEPVRGASTGQRKRIALARALLHEPEVLFLDEPTSGLDPSAIRDVVDLIGTLATEHGRTVVLCTHFLGEAGQLADRMAVLSHGRLHAFGKPSELASGLWRGLPTEIDLGGPSTDELVAAARGVRGVQLVHALPNGLEVVVDERQVLPQLISRLVELDAEVFGVVPHPPTLEDVYFEIEARVATKGSSQLDGEVAPPVAPPSAATRKRRHVRADGGVVGPSTPPPPPPPPPAPHPEEATR